MVQWEESRDQNDLGNGLFLLRSYEDEPKSAVNLDEESGQYGWLFMRIGKLWVAHKKLNRVELANVVNQVEEGIVLKGFGRGRRFRDRRKRKAR